jgi:hypothetical protein
MPFRDCTGIISSLLRWALHQKADCSNYLRIVLEFSPRGFLPMEFIRRLTSSLERARASGSLWGFCRPAAGAMLRRPPATGLVRGALKRLLLTRRVFALAVKAIEEWDMAVCMANCSTREITKGGSRRRGETGYGPSVRLLRYFEAGKLISIRFTTVCIGGRGLFGPQKWMETTGASRRKV